MDWEGGGRGREGEVGVWYGVEVLSFFLLSYHIVSCLGGVVVVGEECLVWKW